jgi:hypothetical protein
MNIRFEYLYRDYGNLKRWGEVIFSNPDSMKIDEIRSRAEEMLIDGLYFWASKAKLPDLHFEDHIEHLDHAWHELHSFQYTDEAPLTPIIVQ